MDQLMFINDHWVNSLIVPEFQRDIFTNVINDINTSEHILTLIGPRRVGKTTVLKQLIKHLIDVMNINPRKIIFFSFDIYKDNLIEILKTHKQITRIDSTRDTIYLILDEIQYLENWAANVKLIFDHRPNIKIILSGSSSSELMKGKESLAGREVELRMEPLSFNEYLRITSEETNKEDLLKLDKWEKYQVYMDHQLPEIAKQPDKAKEIITQLIDKVINYDLPRMYNLSDTQVIYSIFRIICKSPGEIIKFGDLANQYQISSQTVRKYLQYLEDALLIRKVYNYQRNARKSEKSKKRYYPYFTSLHWFAFPFSIEFGKKAETEVAFQLQAEFFWNDRNKEIDFIWGNALTTGIEVKMRNNIRKKDLRWLIQNDTFSNKIVICKPDSKISESLKSNNQKDESVIKFVELTDVGDLALDKATH